MTDNRLNKMWEFDLDTGTRKYKTWVYSDTGEDIEARFQGCKVTNIKEKNVVSKIEEKLLDDSGEFV